MCGIWLEVVVSESMVVVGKWLLTQFFDTVIVTENLSRFEISISHTIFICLSNALSYILIYKIYTDTNVFLYDPSKSYNYIKFKEYF